MVGFHKHDPLTANQKLIAGCMAGVITRFITQPLDIIKLRTQVQKRKMTKISLITIFVRVLREEGMHAFWSGHVLGQCHSILSVSSQFYVYELTTQFTVKNFNVPHEYRALPRLLCGITAGCVSATLVIPLEVIRIRQMLIKDQYGGLLKGAAAVYRYGGILAFYEGLGASLLQMGPQVGISFLVFSQMQPLLLAYLEPDNVEHTYNAESILVSSSIAGAIAGFVSKSITYPLDLAKRRLQLGSHKYNPRYRIPSTAKRLIQCTGLFNCLVKTVQKQGFKGLFQGWTVTVYKAQLTSIVAFTSYELLCAVLRTRL